MRHRVACGLPLDLNAITHLVPPFPPIYLSIVHPSYRLYIKVTSTSDYSFTPLTLLHEYCKSLPLSRLIGRGGVVTVRVGNDRD